jgi:F5/8 type C domain-containing protein
VSSYVRRSFGNSAGFVTPADVARVRAATADRKEMWTLPELVASIPVFVFKDGWKASASHNADAAGDGLTLTGWNSGGPQQADTWFQVEIVKPDRLTEIQFESPPPGGRGAAVALGGAPISTPEGPGYPRGYKVAVSMDGASWKTVAEGSGTGLTTTVVFPPVQARFVRVSLTATPDTGPAWSIQGFRLYASRAGGR